MRAMGMVLGSMYVLVVPAEDTSSQFAPFASSASVGEAEAIEALVKEIP